MGATPVAVVGIDEGVARLVTEISVEKPYHSALLYADGRDGLQQAWRFRRAAPDPAPPMILVVRSDADVPRFDALSAGFSAVLELPFDKRQMFNVLHSVSAGAEMGTSVVRLQDYARRISGARRLRVLVADDNPTNREVLGKILERGGHEVSLVDDGEQALDAVEHQSYDIVLLDRNMPRMGGLEALQAMRLMFVGRDRLPIAILSADVTPEARKECLEAGADAFLSKPVEATRLLEEIQGLAGSRSTEPAPRAAPIEISRSAPRQGTAPQAEIINSDTLTHLEELGSSASFIEKLVGVFLSDSAALLEKIEVALRVRNTQEFRSLLHAMKGSSASMGTDRLTRICSDFGKLSDAELKLQASSLAKALSDELGAARSALESYLRDKRRSTG